MSPASDRTRSSRCQDNSLNQPPGQSHQASQSSPALISVSITDPRVLQRCFLPFLKRGGLFVPGSHQYALRQRVFLIIALPAEPGAADRMTTHALNATVAWLTPAQAPGGNGMGVGLHFDAGAADVRGSIESLLRTSP